VLAEAVAREIRQLGTGCVTTEVDVRSSTDLERMVEEARQRFGGIDILVNITSGPPSGSLLAVDDKTWKKQFESMVLSVFHITNRLLPCMRQRKWGRILTSTSSGVLQPIPNLGISNALRASLVTWSKTLADEVAADGVTVNVIVPGRIHTKRVDMLDQANAKRRNKPVEDIVRESLASIPMGRYGRCDEYASVAAFLVSECASYITGSVVRVDGGYIKAI